MLRGAPLAFSAVTRDLRGAYRRAKRNTALMAAACICFATAYVAGLVAAGAFLAPIYGPGPAALLIAASMAVIGLVVIGVLAFLKHRDKRHSARKAAAQKLAAATAISVLPHVTKSKGLLIAAALGGLAYVLSQAQGGNDDA